jgi:LysR family transcriptional regulator, regulator for genes of the gallate degradation pathway
MIVDPYQLNLRHLRALVSVQDTGSITAGSRLACLSQSALTQGIAKIERQLERPLFERQIYGITLTSPGEVVLQRVRALFEHLSDVTTATGRDVDQFSRSINMTHVRALIALSETRSFAAAAHTANLSQTSVHRAIGDLERILGRALADRRGRGTELTFAGRRVARSFRLVGRELRAMLADINENECSTIAIGALPIARSVIVPTAIARMIEEQGRTHFTVVEGDWQDLVEQLHDGVIDMIIGSASADLGDNLVRTPMVDDSLVIICGSQHPLAATPSPSLEVLARYPWIIGPPQSPGRLQWEKLFEQSRRPEAPVECGSIMVVINLLAQSQLLALVSPAQVQLPLQAKRLAQIGDFIPGSTRSIDIVTRKDWRPTADEHLFTKFIMDAARYSGAAAITKQ